MTHKDVIKVVEEIGVCSAYHHFAEGEAPKPPFLVYLYPKTDNFSADGVVYLKINKLDIELYTDKKDVSLEEKVEAVFTKHGIFYEKSETWIESEKLYEVLYETEVDYGK
jgi:hypothetical protein